MNRCKQVQLSVLGKLHPVLDLVGEESLFKTWHFDLTIQLSLSVDVSTWLLQPAQCYLDDENGNKRIFDGELISVTDMDSYSSDMKRVKVLLSSRLHRLGKSGGARFFKEKCFRDIVFEFLKKHHLLEKLKVFFVSDLGIEQFPYIQQFSEESDAEFIDRYCHERNWLWVLKTSVSGYDTLYFFKKSVRALSEHTVHKGVLGNEKGNCG